MSVMILGKEDKKHLIKSLKILIKVLKENEIETATFESTREVREIDTQHSWKEFEASKSINLTIKISYHKKEV